MRKTKTKCFMFGLVFLLILSVSACGKKGEEQIEEENIENASEFHTEDEVIAEEGTEKGTKEEPDNTEGGTDAVPEESWVNHYYNRGIYFKDGYTYRQFADGLYRRQAGTDSWELLCEITTNYGPGLTCYGDRLYFTGYEEEADTQGSGWNNAVFYYDLDTGESGNLLNVGTLTGALNVYDGCLYVQSFALDGGYMVYDGYRLNEEGEILEQLDSEAEDFLCREQNEYSIAEYELMQGPVSGRRSSGTSIDELKEEVISTPACAAMLDGKVVLRQQKGEGGSNYFLRDLTTGEDELLFDASDILAVMKDGIYYFPSTGAEESLMYYSFADGTNRELPLPEFWQGDNRMMNPSSYITWDQEALYFFNYGSEDDAAQIVKISLSDGSVETIVEGEALMETEAYRINQVDEEYFYHGAQMYPLP